MDIILFISIMVVIGPLFGPGPAAIETRYSEDRVSSCISDPSRPISSNHSATISGSVQRINDTIRISYNVTNESGFNNPFVVRPPRSSKIVQQHGFDTGTFSGGLIWNGSYEIHWIQYRMAASNQIGNFPHGDEWIIASTPSHSGPNVNLSPESEGFIGSNILYLGEYSVKTARTGCQKFQAIVPKQASVIRPIENRLEELALASKRLAVGKKYQTIRVFVSPHNLGRSAGVNLRLQNEIIVWDKPHQNPSIVWIHEYIHTLQRDNAKPEMMWFYEASANYLAYRISVEQGFISPREYDAALVRGANGTWPKPLNLAINEQVSYWRGMLLLARLDNAYLRRSNVTVAGLLDYMNQHRNPGFEQFERYSISEGNLSRSQIRAFRDEIYTTEEMDAPYVLGPSWLSPQLRLAIDSTGDFIIRFLIVITQFSIVVAWLYDNYVKGYSFSRIQKQLRSLR